MNTINKCTIVLENVDLEALRYQKEALIAVIDFFNSKESLTGILHLIDSIQDYAVDVAGLPESEVYNLTNE